MSCTCAAYGGAVCPYCERTYHQAPITPKLDLTKPVQTKNGHPVTVLDQNFNDKMLVSGINERGQKFAFYVAKDGTYSYNHTFDLINAPPKPVSVVRIAALWDTGNVTMLKTGMTMAQAKAKKFSGPQPVAFQEFTITEGEGL
ncbi:MAG TPA: hypothetical protein VIY48_17820 [Candidatus Paceibacterota bacterium]